MQPVATVTKFQPLTISSPTAQGTAELLQQSQKQFIKSDESAFSIVPSRMSSRFSLSTIQTGDPNSVRSSASLEYRRLSFENDLFTARVYKRNYRSPKYQGSRKQNPDRDVEAVDHRKEDTRSPDLTNSSVLDQESIVRDRNVSIDQKYGDFIEACRKGDKDEVSKVLKTSSLYGGTVASKLLLSRKCDSMHLCPIHAAVYGGHLGVMETLLQSDHLEHNGSPESLLFCTGTSVMVHGHKQRSVPPLHFAACKGELPMVQLLLRMGAPINAESDHGVQAIHLAARDGSMDVLAALIAAGASVNCRDYKRRQPIHYISGTRHRPEVIRYLADNGAEIDGDSHMSQPTALGLASKYEIITNVRVLLSLGALVTSPILDTAVRNGSPRLVETLLISTANQEEGQSVMAASLCDYITTAPSWSLYLEVESWARIKLRLLLDYTDLLLKDRNGETVLHRLLDAQWKIDGGVVGSKFFENLLLDLLPDFKTREKDEVRAFVRKKREAFSVKQKVPWSDTSAVLEDHTSESTMKSVKDEISAPMMVQNSLGWNYASISGGGKRPDGVHGNSSLRSPGSENCNEDVGGC